jgi:hypothetical protein
MLIHSSAPVNILFMHHSVGWGIIDQGGVRGLLAEYNRRNGTNYRLWDHGYNGEGLRDPEGVPQNRNFNIPDDNTNPEGYAGIFAQPHNNPPDNAFSHFLEYDVIIFKSCFPACNIENAEKLARWQEYYREIMAVMRRYPDKLFIPSTPPPLTPSWTNRTEALNSRAFVSWLTSQDFLQGATNVVPFDLFSVLAENNSNAPDYSMLRKDFRPGLFGMKKDSHPNKRANLAVAPQLIETITKAIEQFRRVRA